MKLKNYKNRKIKVLFSNQKGMALLTTLIFVFILVTFAVALLTMTSNDTKLSALQRDSTKAFYIAEAGIEKTLYDLKKDFESSQDWKDGNINGYTSSEVPFGEGTYTVTLDIKFSNNVTIKSKGKYDNSIRYVQVDATVGSLSIWDNAIFAGSGASGRVINGNADIRGSVHILGEELDPDDPAVEAIDITGTAGIGNNYNGMDLELRGRIIPPPTTEFNGETIETLNAKLRVQRGKVNLSGTATVGDPDVSGNLYKETLDGVYVTDGFGGNQGESNVYSDNGTEHPYDFGEGTFAFPDLMLDDYIDVASGETITNPSTSKPYTYDGYYNSGNTLKITDSSITSKTPSFTRGDPKTDKNYIIWNKDEMKLTISGIIVIDGNFTIGEKKDSIIYERTGTIVSKGNIYIHSDLLAKNLFPTTDALGLIAYKDIELATGPGDSQLKMMGAFYAQDKITSAKQNEIAGTFVSNYFDMGINVPSIYQVPGLENNLPPGMPGAKITYSMRTSNWHEVHE
jgi:hypothetical protein